MTTLKIEIILGSARENRQSDIIRDWLLRELSEQADIVTTVIDPKDFSLDPNMPSADLQSRIAQADGFIVLAPEYNHGYSGELKLLIDKAYSQWNAKPVGFIGYGGMAGGARSVEQLRQVFCELHAVTMRDFVSFANAPSHFEPDGELAAGAIQKAQLDRLLSYLRWWGRVLQSARKHTPYEEILN